MLRTAEEIMRRMKQLEDESERLSEQQCKLIEEYDELKAELRELLEDRLRAS